jgi:hypothetical protein
VVTSLFTLLIISHTVCTVPVVYLLNQGARAGLIAQWWWRSVYRGNRHHDGCQYHLCSLLSPIQTSIKPSWKAFWFTMKRVEYEGLSKLEKRGWRSGFGLRDEVIFSRKWVSRLCLLQYTVTLLTRSNNSFPAKLHSWMRHTLCVLTVSKKLSNSLVYGFNLLLRL